MIGIIGLGNLLMADDGVGVRVAQRLMEMDLPSQVRVIDGGVGSLSLPFHLFDRLIIIDAVKSHHPPGTLLTYRREEILQGGVDLSKLSLHGLGFHEVLALLELRGEAPRDIRLIGIVPQKISVGMELSPPVQKAVEPAVKRVLETLKEWLPPEKPRLQKTIDKGKF